MKFLLQFILVLGFFPYVATAQETGNKNAKSTQPKKDTVIVEKRIEALEEPVQMIEEPGSFRLDQGSGDQKYETTRINEVAYLIHQYNSTTGYREYGVVKNGKLILPMIFNSGYDEEQYSQPLSRILSLGKMHGVFDVASEKWIVPLQYRYMKIFNSSTFIAVKGALHGIVDITNTIVVPFEWSQLKKIDFVDNYAIVAKDKKFGILNIIDNKLTVPCMYSEISPIENSTAFRVTKQNTYNIVDINNKTRFKNWYQEIRLSPGKRKNYTVKLNGKFGIVDENENTVLAIEYQEITPNHYKDGSYLAKDKNGKYGCVTIDGRITLPFEYDNLTKSISENSVLAIKGNKCGLIQVNDGVPYEIVACDFDTLMHSRTVFIVEKNKKFGLMDLFGKIISPVEFDQIEMVTDESDYNANINKVFIAKKDKLQYLINNKGDTFNDSKYKQILPLYSLIKTDYKIIHKWSNYFVYYKNNKAGVLDVFGKEITANIFDDILLINSTNNLIIKQGDKVGLYSLFGKNMATEPKYDQIFEQNGKIYAQLGNTFYLLTVDNNGKVTESKL